MRGSPKLCSSRRPVALALAGALIFSLSFHTPPSRSAETLAGRAIVIDGDTIDIGGTHVRLEGIDAPEAGQTCARRFIGKWGCGAAASKALGKMIGSRRVNCESRGHDKYGRVLGLCRVDGRDDARVAAIVRQHDMATEWLKDVAWAGRLKLPAGRFDVLEARAVDCINEAYDGL